LECGVAWRGAGAWCWSVGLGLGAWRGVAWCGVGRGVGLGRGVERGVGCVCVGLPAARRAGRERRVKKERGIEMGGEEGEGERERGIEMGEWRGGHGEACQRGSVS